MKKRTYVTAAARVAIAALTLAPAATLLADGDDQFSAWSVPTNLGPDINTAYSEIAPFVSKNEQSLYFFSDRPGGFGGNDIWVSHRATKQDAWGPPQNLGPTVNSAYNDNAPTLSHDGHRLYFASDRPGGYGQLDLYVSHRRGNKDDFSWRSPKNLGIGVNTTADEAAAALFEDDSGITTLYFHSSRPGGLGADDIYSSILDEHEFTPAELVADLSSPFLDRLPSVRKDGLESYVSSNRPGTTGALDIWISTRSSTSEPWSTPTNLVSVVNLNSPAVDGRGVLSSDGKTLYFHSTIPAMGLFDLYVSTRDKLRDDDEDDD